MIDMKPPPISALAGEALTPLELTRLIAASPALARQQRGNSELVLVLPGLGASNASTALMRRYLSWLNYDVHGWTQGTNTGGVRELLPGVVAQAKELHAETGGKLNIIGWSLGGVIAREAARENPALFRQVITMGSPVAGGPKYTSFGRFYEAQGVDLDKFEAMIQARESTPIRIPMTSIYSKRDGIVGWQASIDRYNSQTDHIEVSATHLGLGISPEVFRILAQKLANA